MAFAGFSSWLVLVFGLVGAKVQNATSDFFELFYAVGDVLFDGITQKNGRILSSYRANPMKNGSIVSTMKFVFYGLYVIV